MQKYFKEIFDNKKLLIYTIIIVPYLLISLLNYIDYKIVHDAWRESQIRNSPTVCITSTGEKYHRCYHYSRRNYQKSLFEAVEDGYTPCRVCNPAIMSFNNEPKQTRIYFKYWWIILIIFSSFYWMNYKNIFNEYKR